MRKLTYRLIGLLGSFVMAGVYSPVLADDATPAATAAATPAATAAATPAPPTVVVGGLVDGYYSYNFTNSANQKTGSGNLGYFYNSTDGSYSLGLAEVKVTATQGLASGHIVLAYGQEGGLLIGATQNIGIDVEQAYVSYAPGLFTLSAGRFVTWMGNEVIESTGNWNYSRSLLFNYTIPLWHNGISVAYAPSSMFKVTGYATNGWNNSINTSGATAETYGLSLAYTPSSVWSVTVNGIDGPGTSIATVFAQDRYVGEAIIGYNPTSDWSFALDAELGGQDGSNGTVSNPTFWGADLYAKYAIASDWSAALRLEELKDNANILGIYSSTAVPAITNGGTFGTAYEGREGTLTLTHNFTAAWTVSLEGRYDYALSGGSSVSAFAGTNSSNQVTTTLGTAIAF